MHFHTTVHTNTIVLSDTSVARHEDTTVMSLRSPYEIWF